MVGGCNLRAISGSPARADKVIRIAAATVERIGQSRRKDSKHTYDDIPEQLDFERLRAVAPHPSDLFTRLSFAFSFYALKKATEDVGAGFSLAPAHRASPTQVGGDDQRLAGTNA